MEKVMGEFVLYGSGQWYRAETRWGRDTVQVTAVGDSFVEYSHPRYGTATMSSAEWAGARAVPTDAPVEIVETGVGTAMWFLFGCIVGGGVALASVLAGGGA